MTEMCREIYHRLSHFFKSRCRLCPTSRIAVDEGATDVDAVDAHEGVGHGGAAVGGDRVAQRLSHYFHAHARFNARTVAVAHVLGGDNESCHI